MRSTPVRCIDLPDSPVSRDLWFDREIFDQLAGESQGVRVVIVAVGLVHRIGRLVRGGGGSGQKR